MRRRSFHAASAVLVGASLALSGCSLVGSSTPSSSTPVPPSVTRAPTPTLAKFYSQKIAWKDCDGVQCAKLTVPLDYANPTGATIQLAIDRVPATGSRKGSLVVNPGGPGGSGYDYAAAADQIVTGSIRKAYDVVGFDPRGVQRSDPIECVSGSQLDSILGSDPTPDDAAEVAAATATAKGFGAACKANAGPLLGHVSTVEVARDLDVLRAALGSPKLDYLGKSYGTLIGSTYAGLFPHNVGRMVLDGVVPPDLTSEQVAQGQAGGFELATRSYVANCVSSGDCPLGSSVDAGMARIRSFLKQVDAQPLPVSGQGDVKQLTEGWASLGIAEAMYDKGSWSTLTKAMKQAFDGKGDRLMALADQYADRSSDGTYDGNIMQVGNAVNCLDQPSSTSASTYEADVTSFSKSAPTWGPFLAWSGLTCAEWPIKATGTAHRISAAGSGPVLVVGTTRDPATPYAWSQRLASELSNGHLLTYDGDGHTAYGQSGCVDDTVDAYLLKGTVPTEGKRC
ncbi:alpha/beta hydrolase [Allobranchiibius sp. GilTou38]|uniref:alpha/beta hydrolase n=1 Tax=Allobranchiibius sp. GilTou38 TaxID=2815210 RepID=UPI001AA1D1A1|nr:alpha/beta hydrolase [Allobranchiibius sp. GilTou38]MBO1766116.1 alpha/beta fold hydrolase [Allobranchiibius sp. GilTou38]